MKNKDFNNLLKSIDQARKIHAKKIKSNRTFKIIKLSEIKYKKLIKELDSIRCGAKTYVREHCEYIYTCENHKSIDKVKKLLKIKDENEKIRRKNA